MQNKSIQKFFEEDLRCEELIPLYMCLTDVPSASFKDAVLEEPEVCELLGIPLDIVDYDEIHNIVLTNSKLGFLSQFSTPRPIRLTKDKKNVISGWGFYATKWFYAESVDDLEKQAFEWKDEFLQGCVLDLRKKEEGL